MAAKATSDTKGKPAGKGGLIATVGVLTALAAGGGGLVGKLLGHPPAAAPTGTEAAKPLPYAGDIEVRELPSVVTNLAAPEESRVRLQVAMVYPKAGVENPTLLAARINDDIVAFLKTLTVTDLQGPSGLQALREDLNERARTRSDGKVREIVIEALVVQ